MKVGGFKVSGRSAHRRSADARHPKVTKSILMIKLSTMLEKRKIGLIEANWFNRSQDKFVVKMVNTLEDNIYICATDRPTALQGIYQSLPMM